MKKQLLISIIAILVSIGLSGCQESQTTGDMNKVQLVEYNVETYYNYSTFFTEKLGDGFIHNNSYSKRCYSIRGTIKNTAEEMLNTVVISLNFYDNDNNFLTSKTYTIRYLDNSETENFEVIYYDLDPYFDDIDELKFEFTVT